MFTNRIQAGQLLSEKLAELKINNPLVLALPRGGVPVAVAIAKKLMVPLEVLVVRKIGIPFHSELAAGAICEGENPIWNENVLEHLDLRVEELQGETFAQTMKINEQIKSFRQNREMPNFKGKTVVLVDDGLATGATAIAAIEHLKKSSAAKIILAVPVAAQETAIRLRKKVDVLVVLEENPRLTSVGQWYQDFSQITDDQVIEILENGLTWH